MLAALCVWSPAVVFLGAFLFLFLCWSYRFLIWCLSWNILAIVGAAVSSVLAVDPNLFLDSICQNEAAVGSD